MPRGNAVRSVWRQPRRDPNVGPSVHRRCHKCGRLLAPDAAGNMPVHKLPKRIRDTGRNYVPLTGADAPWCSE